MDNSKNGLGIFIIAIVAVGTLVLATGVASAAVTHTVCSSGCDFTGIQLAVTAASAGDTIIVKDGTYIENIDVEVERLTIRSENGFANCIVTANDTNDHVFEVEENRVNITGFTVQNATGAGKAGICLDDVSYCTISNNYATNNYYGSYLDDGSIYNNLLGNIANMNGDNGIELEDSDHNNIIGNTVNSNTYWGISLDSSNDNNITNNICAYNGLATGYDGIGLKDSDNNIISKNNCLSNDWAGICLGAYSSNNTVTDNTCSGNYEGLQLRETSNNTLTNNKVSDNDYGVYLQDYADYNTVTNNIVNSNNNDGIYLSYSSNNNITCNLIHNNNQSGFYLTGGPTVGSTGNTITQNNIVSNGAEQPDESWHYNFYNDQNDNVTAKYNYWGTTNPTVIAASINENTGTVDFEPFLSASAPCAPAIPVSEEVPILTPIGIVALIGLLSAIAAVTVVRKRR